MELQRTGVGSIRGQAKMELAGKVALVTGASRGIGRACAIRFAQAGAKVGVNYRSHADEAEEVVAACRAAGSDAIAIQGDVANREDVEAAVEKTVAAFGRLDLFVSNAAYSDRQLMLDAELAGFERTINVTMWGAFNGLRAAARQMDRQGEGGSIVIVSSPHAVIAIPTAMAYNMAKAAIDHMARTAAIELAPKRIRVNLMHPGWIDTPGERKFFSEQQLEQGAASLPWKRLGTPEEIANVIYFMASPACDYMTGSTVTVDGGVSLPWWSNRAEGKQ